jgi:hypothetical protein
MARRATAGQGMNNPFPQAAVRSGLVSQGAVGSGMARQGMNNPFPPGAERSGMDGRGLVWLGTVPSGTGPGRMWHGGPGLGRARRGTQFPPGGARIARVRTGAARLGRPRRGWVRPNTKISPRHGSVGYGEPRRGRARHGEATIILISTRIGLAGRGRAGRDAAWLGKATFQSLFPRGSAGYGMVRPGRSGYGMAKTLPISPRQGLAGIGVPRFVKARRDEAGTGKPRCVMARTVEARQGQFQFPFRPRPGQVVRGVRGRGTVRYGRARHGMAPIHPSSFILHPSPC